MSYLALARRSACRRGSCYHALRGPLALAGVALSVLSLLFGVAPSVGASASSTNAVAEGPRHVTFVNHLDETIWVAASPGNPPDQLSVTGWLLAAGQTLTVTVPNHWNGRFWGRTGCHFDAAGRGGCQTGDCSGRFMCKGFGAIPATLAEYDLDAWDHLDFYDVSMVDGSNLPVYINQSGGRGEDPISPDGCIPEGCTKAVVCPTVLQVKVAGKAVACISACARFGTDQYCCRGKWAPRSVCDPARWPVDYAAVFKRAEPYAYSYVYDDATSVYTCSGRCDYRITFGLSPPGARPPRAKSRA
ncbi:MAG TPA: thaumatin family protein [Acidimicrobiales bacterium]|nr:thaumatin family protein [Acidimicrobiales bacterium]